MFNFKKIGGVLPPLRSPRPDLLPQPYIGLPWRHRWTQEEVTITLMKCVET